MIPGIKVRPVYNNLRYSYPRTRVAWLGAQRGTQQDTGEETWPGADLEVFRLIRRRGVYIPDRNLLEPASMQLISG